MIFFQLFFMVSSLSSGIVRCLEKEKTHSDQAELWGIGWSTLSTSFRKWFSPKAACLPPTIPQIGARRSAGSLWPQLSGREVLKYIPIILNDILRHTVWKILQSLFFIHWKEKSALPLTGYRQVAEEYTSQDNVSSGPGFPPVCHILFLGILLAWCSDLL